VTLFQKLLLIFEMIRKQVQRTKNGHYSNHSTILRRSNLIKL